MPNVQALATQPWRFKSGDKVYVRGWPIGSEATVTKQITPRDCELHRTLTVRYGRTFPAYFVVDKDGNEWTVPQIAMSKSVIPADS